MPNPSAPLEAELCSERVPSPLLSLVPLLISSLQEAPGVSGGENLSLLVSKGPAMALHSHTDGCGGTELVTIVQSIARAQGLGAGSSAPCHLL